MSLPRNDLTLPPGPYGDPNEELARFNADPFGRLETLAAQYGDLFAIPLGTLGQPELPQITSNGLWVFLSRPHQLKIMYEAGDATASGAQANKVFFGTDEASVAYIDGTAHRRRRAQLHPTFNGGRDYAELILEVLDSRVVNWPRDTAFPLFRELQKLTAEVITRIVCGHMSTVDRSSLAKILLRTEDARCTRDELIAADRDSRAFIQERIEQHPTGPGDVLATLLKLAEDGDTTLTGEVIRDEVFGLLYTGFSTTANTLAWAFVEILSDPRVRERLTGELSGIPVTREALNSLPYLEATLKETLRLHPVTPLNGVRLLHRDLEIDGHDIPAGSILVHCAYLLQRSPAVHPEPLAFRPERFLDAPTDPYAWGAFGGGHRMCVGRGFSMNEMKVVLARLLTSHHLERPGTATPKARQQGFFMAPADDAEVILR